jgi:NAD(P)-dependent dehydrogenase (short-subunit alcohol dehydrogenase family)
MQLAGKSALITGGASGIGRGIALRYAQEGADICIADIDAEGAAQTAAMVEAEGRRALAITADVTKPGDTRHMISAARDQLGDIDIAVANAGIARGGPFLDAQLADWQAVIDVNMTGVFLTAQAAARAMVDQGHGGRIILISSTASERTGAGVGIYSASKAAVRMLTRSWARELADHHINVNAIGPGVIDTPMTADRIRGIATPHDPSTLPWSIPWGRVGEPSDVAGVAVFLASSDAGYLTGQIVFVDGGLTA